MKYGLLTGSLYSFSMHHRKYNSKKKKKSSTSSLINFDDFVKYRSDKERIISVSDIAYLEPF